MSVDAKRLDPFSIAVEYVPSNSSETTHVVGMEPAGIDNGSKTAMNFSSLSELRIKVASTTVEAGRSPGLVRQMPASRLGTTVDVLASSTVSPASKAS
jgi:hypothetical protein